MLLTLLVSGFLALNPFQPAPRVPLVAPAASSIDPCRVYGTVYLETDPRRQSRCFGSIYMEPEADFADLMVFKETSKLFADKVGLWYLTDSPNFADYSLFVTSNRNLADFSIQFTKSRTFAGCRKQ